MASSAKQMPLYGLELVEIIPKKTVKKDEQKYLTISMNSRKLFSLKDDGKERVNTSGRKAGDCGMMKVNKKWV